ncbi:hypothetical protein N875_01115 [Neisseria meningitidis LNP21362]|nr:hypothetical protein N875_01115 [Neisseria meningitidis LNP21362]
MEVVASDGFADQSDFRQHRPSAAVRAAGNAGNDVVVRRAVFRHNLIQLADEVRQHAFGFRHCQRAGRKGNAGHRIFTQLADIVAD